MRKTKIICTLGPASDGAGVLEQLMLSGMDCARFNFSHGTHADHKARMDRVKELRRKHGLPTAIMLDTKGPELRLGKFRGGEAVLREGQEFTFRAAPCDGDETGVQVSFPRLAENVAPGARILVDDGKVAFTVTSVRGGDVVCQALNGGRLSDRKSINLPNSDIDMPYISEADRSDLLFGISFPRYSTRTLEAMSFAKTRGAQVIGLTDGPMSPVYATSTVCLTARTDMASFVDSMAAPLSVINALIVALGLRRKDELSEHFRLMEGIWDEYRVYVGKDRV